MQIELAETARHRIGFAIVLLGMFANHVERGHEDAAGNLHLAFDNGFLHVLKDTNGSALMLEARDAQTLQSLRDSVIEGAAKRT